MKIKNKKTVKINARTAKGVTYSRISKAQKRKFTREMAKRIWSDSSFLEKELSKYENIKVIYD